jgi:dihydroorotate dehydrogenase
VNFYKIFRPLIFKFDAEIAHNLAIKFLKFMPKSATLFCFNRRYKNLQTKLWDIDFANPIGLAAGFDKNAEVINVLSKFGFGFLEIGTVTPRVQIGNVKPRLFRLCEDKAIINRLGFNNLGAEDFAKNLEKAMPQVSYALGVNIGKNKDTEDMLVDYLVLLKKFYTKATYITVNISSPNLKNLRDLQGGERLDPFLMAIMEKKNELKERCKRNVPILLKIAPDLTPDEQEKIAEIVIKNKVDGLIISNTTIFRDPNLKSENTAEVGGLSGKPLFEQSNQVLKNIYKFTEGKIPIIGVGGVSSAADVYEKIKCGASLVQIYSAFVYEGFGLVERIKKDLSEMIKEDGLENISQAVGFYLK